MPPTLIKSASLAAVKEEDVDREIEEEEGEVGTSSELFIRKKKWKNPFQGAWGTGENAAYLGIDVLFQDFDKSFLRLLGL